MTARKAEAVGETRATGLVLVGQQLAAERESQELTIESVASELNLTRDVVRALEEGDESRLPVLTFVRGYVRTYARRLGLDDAELIAHLPSTVTQQAAPLKSASYTSRRRHLRFPAGKLLLWMLLLAALVTLAIYAAPIVEQLLSRTTAAQEEDTNSLELPLSGVPADGQPVDDSTGALEIEDPLPAVAAAEQTVSTTPAASGETELPMPANSAAEPGVALATPAGNSSAEQPVQPAESTLLLRFNEDSWVEVKAQGEKLTARIEPAGSERTIRAAPPMDVLLGNAPAVEVIYNGVVIDTGEYQRGKVARLVLGR